VGFSRAEWAERKADIATRLAGGECGGGYGEAVLILSAAISAMAAEAWPGDGIDRRRFIEFVVRFSTTPISPETISVPLLIGDLRDRNVTVTAEAIRKSFPIHPESQVLTWTDVDRTEKDIVAVCSIAPKELREFSYANLIYRRVRSALAHEYRTGPKTVSHAMTDNDSARVSYFNWIGEPDRHSHFHVPWLASLTMDLGRRADMEAKGFPIATPSKWWIDG